MLQLVVGTQGPARNGLDVVRFGEAVTRLAQDQTFGILLTEAVDDLVHTWSLATEPAVREGMWHKIQGLQHLLSYMQRMVEQGNLASLREGDGAEKRPSTT